MKRSTIYEFEVEEARRQAKRQEQSETLWVILESIAFLLACGGVIFFLYACLV